MDMTGGEQEICTAIRRRVAAEGITPETLAAFQRLVYEHYRRHPRSFPWRETRDPYRILVSEVMLQQTPVERVRDTFTAFVAAFPDFASLARASLQEVLAAWQGLGYNRRAVALNRTAQEVVQRFDGVLPSDEATLRSLPGIGPYTAAAVRAFAFDRPAVVIDTNIRAVFIHCFLGEASKVSDAALRPLVEQSMDREHPRDWYSALMDFGALVKQRHPNPSRKSAHYSRQTPFEGSNRQVRGRILKAVLAEPGISREDLADALGVSLHRVTPLVDQLKREGFIAEERTGLRIA
ncbi:MAG: winged helix-turn-helix transcriptional regulator [Candidatus Thermoplasmatota archaeon]|nr:winged helix-turn-helix transcriptional regulator [Candidatus Thermoplasmatota archaeon]MDD5778142.1 winged helix-turn-helix transcriptional regulator [Candidatus Thermoplasmatota archaeon]